MVANGTGKHMGNDSGDASMDMNGRNGRWNGFRDRQSRGSRSRRGVLSAIAALGIAAALAIAGCSGADGNGSGRAYDADTDLRVLAGSEVKDMQPILDEAEKETGVHVTLTYMGTLDGTEKVMNGGDSDYDATWFPSDAYMSLFDDKSKKVSQETSIMRTPVVMGVKKDKADELGLGQSPKWADIVSAAKSGRLRFGMSSPVSSNSGFSTVVEMATALSDTGNALTTDDVKKVESQLKDFASGQQLASGSSGWLMEAYQKDPSKVDAVFNYESLIKQDDTLVEVVPQDGVITADYPLALLSGKSDKANENYRMLTDYLKRDDVQRKIADQTKRRTDATNASDATQAFEVPFPNRLDTVRTLLSTWVSEVRKPANMVFQLDTSGSMRGDRLQELKDALTALTSNGSDTSSGTDTLLTFQPRETAEMVDFASSVKSTEKFDFSDKDAESKLSEYIDGLDAQGGTAIYDTLETSLADAAKGKGADKVTSVVLLTDGENTDGEGWDAFRRWYDQHDEVHGIPVYTVLFGDSSKDEMTQIADLTGGKVFDAESGDLTSAFKEIRGYL